MMMMTTTMTVVVVVTMMMLAVCLCPTQGQSPPTPPLQRCSGVINLFVLRIQCLSVPFTASVGLPSPARPRMKLELLLLGSLPWTACPVLSPDFNSRLNLSPPTTGYKQQELHCPSYSLSCPRSFLFPQSNLPGTCELGSEGRRNRTKRRCLSLHGTRGTMITQADWK